jgi:phage baseplate assembly protein W
MDDHNFLGQGWAFPPEFSLKDGAAVLVRGQADITQSLQILLSTQLGERVMHPDFGCNLQQFVFEKVNTTTITYLRDTIETAILYHEPRIVVEQVSVEQRVAEGVLMFEIIYVISATNTRSNFVFPFYIAEATSRFINPQT